jgi:hypothetical protein
LDCVHFLAFVPNTAVNMAVRIRVQVLAVDSLGLFSEVELGGNSTLRF